MAASNRTVAFTDVLYAVHRSGEAWYQPTVASTDSPDYDADKTEALTQCQLISPEGQEVLG